MTDPGDIDQEALAGLLRSDKMIGDAEIMLGPGAAVTAVITPQGFRTGPVLRDRVLRLAGEAADRIQVLVVGEIPRGSDGSLDADAVLARLGNAYRFEPPATSSEAVLAELVGRILPGVRVSMTDTVAGLGGDSISTIELAVLIAERFGVEVPAQQVFGAASLRELAAVAEAGTSHDS